ncbi:MAG: hypothetical protein M1830_000915 [Pleopsidium flavum]|nr:MAG: hypothetical protein M1830_009234 [Pleopsidium flavum]KAI9878432.1 MAG: hypothetical protein M1830_000915 [Pleopsidium flavum]
MTYSLATDIDILVHISAPSGAKDDARYREQARALLGFEAASKHTVLRSGTRQAEAAANTTDQDVLLTGRYTAQSTSYSSAIDQGQIRINLCAAASPIVQSTVCERPQTAPSAATPPFTNTRVLRRTQSDSWGTPPSVVPDSQPLIPVDYPSSPEHPICKRQAPHPALEEPPSKRPRLKCPAPFPSVTSASTSLAPTVSDNADFASATPTQSPSSAPSPSDAHQSSQPLPPFASRTHPHIQTIHPPPPHTTSLPFKTHITRSLALLAQELTNRYRPLSATRPLRTLERGYWAVDCSHFDSVLRVRMWKFLTDFVGAGRAGWGVWCEWCAEPTPSSRSQSTYDSKAGIAEAIRKDNKNREEQRDTLKVYCWGEVVAHIYMVLFVASERMIKGTGARWVDGGGEVVVRMS